MYVPACTPRIMLLVMIKNMMKFWTCASVKLKVPQLFKLKCFSMCAINKCKPYKVRLVYMYISFLYVLSATERAHGPNGIRLLFRTRFSLRSLNFISSLLDTWNFTKLKGDSFSSLSMISGSRKVWSVVFKVTNFKMHILPFGEQIQRR